MKTTTTPSILPRADRIPFRPGGPLPSWNDTAPKKAIIEFVEEVTKEGSPNFVPSRNA